MYKLKHVMTEIPSIWRRSICDMMSATPFYMSRKLSI